ncbi:hypothetical protein MRX96_023555 [Rhipicephalus microplus]
MRLFHDGPSEVPAVAAGGARVEDLVECEAFLLAFTACLMWDPCRVVWAWLFSRLSRNITTKCRWPLASEVVVLRQGTHLTAGIKALLLAGEWDVRMHTTQR